MHHPTDRIAHTTAFVTSVVEHRLEREIAQWVKEHQYISYQWRFAIKCRIAIKMKTHFIFRFCPNLTYKMISIISNNNMFEIQFNQLINRVTIIAFIGAIYSNTTYANFSALQTGHINWIHAWLPFREMDNKWIEIRQIYGNIYRK